MPLLDEITPYIDGNGLVSPNENPGQRGSDNGVLYTSQLLMLAPTDTITYAAIVPFRDAINRCIDEQGNLHRAPGDTTTDAPDDYYGLLSLYLVYFKFKQIKLPLTKWHPVLVYMYLYSQYTFVTTVLAFLLQPLVGLIVALSNLGESTQNTSNKLLTWCAVEGVSTHSRLLGLACRMWKWRMKKIYKSETTMKEIFTIYFGSNHPFTKYVKE